MRFLEDETTRAMRANPFAVEYYAEAERLLSGIRDMLPSRHGVGAYQPTPEELIGKLVVAPVLSGVGAPPQEAAPWLTGILRVSGGRYMIYGRAINPEQASPLTREDIDLMQDLLSQDRLGPG